MTGTGLTSPTLALGKGTGTSLTYTALENLLSGTTRWTASLLINNNNTVSGNTRTFTNWWQRVNAAWQPASVFAPFIDWVLTLNFSAITTITNVNVVVHALQVQGPPGSMLCAGPACVEFKHAEAWRKHREGDSDSYIKAMVKRDLDELRVLNRIESKVLDQQVELEMMRRALSVQSELKLLRGPKEDGQASGAPRTLSLDSEDDGFEHLGLQDQKAFIRRVEETGRTQGRGYIRDSSGAVHDHSPLSDVKEQHYSERVNTQLREGTGGHGQGADGGGGSTTRVGITFTPRSAESGPSEAAAVQASRAKSGTQGGAEGRRSVTAA